MILSWVLFPLVLAVIAAGWGAIVERAGGTALPGALLLPLGAAAALVLGGTLTAFAATVQAAVPVVAAGAVAGLLFAWPGRRLRLWPMLAGVGVLLVYGAPVLLSGQATFTGFVKLDDTATWFNVVDHLMTHARSVSGEPASTYRLLFTGDVGPTYPLGAFVLPGIARALVGVDIAWVFQPYLACCGVAVGLSIYALVEPLVPSPRLRAPLAFVAAQPALLFGYSLWGGVKEMTAAFTLALGIGLCALLLRRRPAGWREALPLAIAAGALIQVLGPGAAGWIAPALVLLAAAWWRRTPPLRGALAPLARIVALTAACVVPVWVTLSGFLSNQGDTIDQLFSSGQSQAVKLGNLFHPLSAFQLAGIWPVDDFRRTAPALPSALLIGVVVLAAASALWMSMRRREYGIPLYVAVVGSACGLLYLAGSTPWVMGKTLAISSPALLAAALAGGGMLLGRRRASRSSGIAGVAVLTVLIGGVLWSNVLAYSDVTLAPRERMAELQHIGGLLDGKGPTFVNEYEVYGDRHFLREGAPVEPAEYRTQNLALRNGLVLTKAAAADLDSFPLSTLAPYRSIVIRRSPTESRPPSTYRLLWRGRFYELWQRPAHPSVRILEHVPLGESNQLPYCGTAQDGPYEPLCSVDPVAAASCPRIHQLAAQAAADHAWLVAYRHPAPIVARGDETQWPATWFHSRSEHTLTPSEPGEVIAHIALDSDQSYELWLGGSFARGFRVSVDGRYIGKVENELSNIDGYVHVADIPLARGVHTFALSYPGASAAPGGAENELTTLSAIALQPQDPSELLTVAPRQAERLCGLPLDWLELVTTS